MEVQQGKFTRSQVLHRLASTVARGRAGATHCGLLLIIVTGIACSSQELGGGDGTTATKGIQTQTRSPGEDQLIALLRASFQSRNPRLTQVGVLDLKAWDFVGPRLILAWAIVADHRFRGNFNDEMFGVFVVDETLTRIERVVDTFPTRGWLDYELRFGRFTADSVEVIGRGATHGEDMTRRPYKWR